jgi:hypothetical protein
MKTWVNVIDPEIECPWCGIGLDVEGDKSSYVQSLRQMDYDTHRNKAYGRALRKTVIVISLLSITAIRLTVRWQ